MSIWIAADDLKKGCFVAYVTLTGESRICCSGGFPTRKAAREWAKETFGVR